MPHRIDMRPGDDASSFIGACRPTPEIPNRIAVCLEAGVCQPAFNVIERSRPGIPIQRTVGSAARLGGDRVELVQPTFEQRAINPHGAYQ